MQSTGQTKQDPPQSIDVSSPSRTPFEQWLAFGQEGPTSIPVSFPSCIPLKQFGHAGHEGPPQSTDVSVPFSIPSEQEVQENGAENPELFVPPSEWKTIVKHPVDEEIFIGSPEDDWASLTPPVLSTPS